MITMATDNNSNVTDYPSVAMDTADEYHVAMWLAKYVLIVIIVAGTIGNVLSFLVLVRKRMRRTSINIYLAYLAWADIAVLYSSGFKTWLRVVTKFELLHTSAFACKTLTFVFMVFLHVSAWLIVLVTLDRFLAVWFPFKAAIWCSPRRSRIIAVVMTILVLVYHTHLFWTNHLQELQLPDGRVIRQCAPLVSNHFMNGSYNYMKFASYSIIPFVLVLTVNAGIIFRICNRSHNRLLRPVQKARKSDCEMCPLGQGHVTRACVADKQVNNKPQLTMMLLLVSLVWLFLTLPFTVISIIPLNFPNDHSRYMSFLAKTCCFLLMYLNHSINFFLYCIAGQRFRQELIAMFCELAARFSRNGRHVTAAGFEGSRVTRPKRTAPPPTIVNDDCGSDTLHNV